MRIHPTGRSPRRRRSPRDVPSGKAKGPRLSWAVHRDLARLLHDWSGHFRRLGSAAFALLVLLEGLRMTSPKPDRFHYATFAGEMGVSAVTLRRWLRTLKKAGLVTTAFVPGTNNAQAFYQIHLEVDHRAHRTPRDPPTSRRRSPGRRGRRQ